MKFLKHIWFYFACMALFVAACETVDKAEFLYEEDLSKMTRLSLESDKSGIYPNEAVLEEPQNPFTRGPIGDETKWHIASFAPNPASFYCWATMLAREPTGEHQYYAARSLALVYLNQEAKTQNLPIIKDMAIAGFQALLDHFPDSVSYLPDGKSSFRLAPFAYFAIKDLGGNPDGDWVEVVLADGTTTVIQGRVDNSPEPEEKEEEE